MLIRAAGGTFTVGPDLGLILFTVAVLLMVPAALVTIAKGRHGWFLAGLLLGVTFFYSAFLPAVPGSLWARRIARTRRPAS